VLSTSNSIQIADVWQKKNDDARLLHRIASLLSLVPFFGNLVLETFAISLLKQYCTYPG
jgi:hypothetical protein